jgi:membrane protein YqaA with SNARE-associated domain
MPNEEEGWIAEFEAAGEDEVRIRLYLGSGMHPEPKFHAAVRWLREQARARKLRDEENHRYVWWTLCAAVLSVIVGVIVLVVTWFGR